jgi:Alw26I/Eco31I/Esp3I family type II restriction m6 adenine DNA methyltransferase
MSAPDDVKKLVERFEDNREAYRSGKYNETQLRNEFLNPFLEHLGWDLFNKRGYAETYKEVVHEDSLEIEGANKAPDYAFRIGGTRKFFVEAKKPSVKIETDIHPAFQLRRYAWSAKLPLSILTDFEEFAVYDCRFKPHKADRASIARVALYNFKEYPEKWDEIAARFSHEAVLKGSFDQYAEGLKGKKGTTEVDDAFLEEIERWRDLFARNIAIRNPKLSVHELNYAVQMTIDRIIFLRICEDRGVERDEQLKDIAAERHLYPSLCRLFQLADARYNSGLFHFKDEKEQFSPADSLTLGLKIDDNVLQDILNNLYYPDSPYVFKEIPLYILGQVYERFLGKVIRLTAGHQAKVEEKPEVRKAGGVYYTPTYIVDYIVQNTVGRLLEGINLKDAARLKILDPACGSGTFLLGAYRYLLDWYLNWYIRHEPEKLATGRQPVIYQGKGGDWKLTTIEKKRILLNNIFGVDIDAQAVEVTKLSLLLKVLEDESQETIGSQLLLLHERVLPDLGKNIQCGNSLIGPEYYEGRQLTMLVDEEERYRVNAFNWKAAFPEVFIQGGFDVVIGNPPYDVMEKERGESSWPHTALIEYVHLRQEYEFALGGKLNLFRFFVILSLNLLRKGGWYGMIVPLSLLADISCSQTRGYVMSNSVQLTADCFPQKDNPNRRVFHDAKLSTCVINCQKSKIEEMKAQIKVRTYPWNKFGDAHKEADIRLADISLIDPENVPIPLVNSTEWEVCKHIYMKANVSRLGEIKDFSVTRGEINQTLYRKFISENAKDVRLVKGVEVGQYRLNEKLSQGHREWFDEAAYLRGNKAKSIKNQKRIATQRITGVDEKLRIVATIIDPPAYFADSTNSITKKDSSVYGFEYLLGLLNSQLFQWRFKLTSTNNNVGTNELNSMPFRFIDFSDSRDKARHERMVSLVKRMLELHKQSPRTPQEQEIVKREIESTYRAIDSLVYELYGLTEEEIIVLEGQ